MLSNLQIITNNINMTEDSAAIQNELWRKRPSGTIRSSMRTNAVLPLRREDPPLAVTQAGNWGLGSNFREEAKGQ